MACSMGCSTLSIAKRERSIHAASVCQSGTAWSSMDHTTVEVREHILSARPSSRAGAYSVRRFR